MQNSDQNQKTTAEDGSRQNMQELADQVDAGVMQRQELLDTIAAKLVAARELRGEKIDQAVRKLKLSRTHLEALEQGNWELLPDEIYALGFLRQYCQYLQLDLTDEIKQLKNEKYTLGKPLTFPDPPVAPSKKWAWLAGAGFIILLALFNVLNNNEQQQQIAADSELTDSEQVEPVPEQYQPATEPDETEVDVTPEKTSHKPIVDLQAATPDAIRAASEKPEQVKKAITHRYKFEAVTGAVWIQIFAPDEAGSGRGMLLKEVLLQRGQFSIITRAVDSLWINCGNAPSLRVTVDGRTVADTGALGGGKKVMRDYHFRIKE